MTAPAFAATFILAEAASVSAEPWAPTLLNYGIAGVMILWFMWRDKRDSETMDRRHAENLAAQKAVESAFRTTTTSIIVGMLAMKQIDGAYTDLLARIDGENKASK